ncbi:uncharacterized protein [Epargyreus clarus]|uniref:uncharacterized protein n=1 Tax=Epargyreus clarus TaxID=520877 RepID=UPI003C2E8887
MTSTAAVVLALSLLINDITLLNISSGLKEEYFSSKLVFLLGVALLLREMRLFPRLIRAKFAMICFLLEIPISMLLLECSLVYVWQLIQDYVLQNIDELLVFLSSEDRLEWLMCHLCCGKQDCSEVSARLVLTLVSFCILLSVCCLVKKK